MPSEPFRAALIGAGGFGANTLRALRDCPLVELVGVADVDASATSQAAGTHCPSYTDNRRLLAETRPHGVFLAVPPVPAGEVARLAGQRGIHVWREIPAALDLPEAVALGRAMESAGLKFAVGTQRRFMLGYRRARHLVSELGQVHLLEAHYLFNWGPILGWRGDKASGGGVLMSLGYHMFDLVLWLLGLPETVYSIAGTGDLRTGKAAPRARDRRGGPPSRNGRQTSGPEATGDQPLYDTEDTAVAVFRYADKASATITVSRCFNPVSEGLILYGEAGSLIAGPDRCVLRDRDGSPIDTFQQDDPPAAVFIRQVEAFVRAAGESAARYECSGRENLLTMAAIDAAYLSDQTAQPESPATLLAGYDLTPGDCLALAPPDRKQS